MAKKNQQPPRQDDGDDDDDVEFSPRQLEILNTQVNATVSAMLNRKLKPFQDQLAVLPTIQESLEKLAAGGGSGAGAQGGAGGQQGQGQQQHPATPKLEDHPEFIAMKKRDAAREAEAQQQRLDARNAKRDTSLTEIVTTAGVDKLRIRGAVALLRDQVKFDKDGNPFMSVKRNGYDEDVPLVDGAAEWLKSDEGKSYLAPQQGQRQQQQQRGTNASSVVRGGGAAGAQGGTNNAPVRGAAENKAERRQQARENLRSAVIDLVNGGSSVDIT